MTVFASHPLYYLVVNFGTKVPCHGKTGLWVKQLQNYSDGQSCSGVIIARYSERVELQLHTTPFMQSEVSCFHTGGVMVKLFSFPPL